MKLTEHFSFDELTRTGVSIMQDKNRAQAKRYTQELTLLAEALEELRASLGKPINISSGYRCEELNTLVGGAKRSSHMSGLAADINVEGMRASELFTAIRLNPPTHLAKCIIEAIGSKEWVHFAVSPEVQERVFLSTIDGKNYTRIA